MDGGMRSDVETHDAGTAALAAELGRQTALLRALHQQGHEPRLEDVQTFALAPGGAQVIVFTPAVPTTGALEIEAWQTGSANLSPFLLDGDYSAGQHAVVLGQTSGWVPVLMGIPTGARASIRLPSWSGKLSLCTLTLPGAGTSVLVTIRVRAHVKGEGAR